jgi:hypothetical protein
MFVLCCVFGALLSGRSPHLKRQVNIVFFFTLSIYKGIFTYFILLSLVSG